MITINNIVNIGVLLIMMLGLLYVYFKLVSVRQEKGLIIKLIAYYLLGSFSINLNDLAIPAGFIVFVLFFTFSLNTIVNLKAKKTAAMLGLAAFILSVIIPTLTASYLNRPKEVPTSSANLYTMDFSRDWHNIQQKLSIPENAKAEDYSLDYDQNGQVKALKFELIARIQGQLTHYQVNLKPAKGIYQVRTNKVDQWLQYDRLIQADSFFATLNTLDLQKMVPKGNYAWLVLNSTGERVNYNIANAKPYLIKRDKIVELSRTQLPITGYYLSSYGMYQTGHDGNTKSYEGRGTQNYLFDTETE